MRRVVTSSVSGASMGCVSVGSDIGGGSPSGAGQIDRDWRRMIANRSRRASGQPPLPSPFPAWELKTKTTTETPANAIEVSNLVKTVRARSAHALAAAAPEAGLEITDITTEEPDLEEVFLSLTS